MFGWISMETEMLNLADFLAFVAVFGNAYSPGDGQGVRSDLVVESVSVTRDSLQPGETFGVTATVHNRGIGTADATTLHYYQSEDATISTVDNQVGVEWMGGLVGSGTSAATVSLTAPSRAGTYYYGACVAPVSGESNANNNCSFGVRVIVSEGDVLGAGAIRRLTRNSAYDGVTSWSPDGRSIAFTSDPRWQQ